MKKNSSLIVVFFVFVFLFVSVNLNALSTKVIYATYVNGFGSYNGWANVNLAEGFIGYPDELDDNDYAWKQIYGDDYWGRLIKAYTFENWTASSTISNVRAYAEVHFDDWYCLGRSVEIQFRAYNGTEVIKSKLFYIDSAWEGTWPNVTPVTTIIEIYLPVPEGGWTKEKVDDIQLWIGAKEMKVGSLHVYWFKKIITYQ